MSLAENLELQYPGYSSPWEKFYNNYIVNFSYIILKILLETNHIITLTLVYKVHMIPQKSWISQNISSSKSWLFLQRHEYFWF